MSVVHGHLRAFCDAICNAPVPGEFASIEQIRAQVREFVADPWPGESADRAVQDYFTCVPSHVLACTDLDFQKFSATTPLHIAEQRPGLQLHHILEIFSKTTPQVYGSIWLPVLDVADAVTPPNANHRPGLSRARMHLQSQMNNANPLYQGVDPSMALDGVMRNILQS